MIGNHIKSLKPFPSMLGNLFWTPKQLPSIGGLLSNPSERLPTTEKSIAGNGEQHSGLEKYFNAAGVP